MDATYVRDVDLKAWAELPGEFSAFVWSFSGLGLE